MQKTLVKCPECKNVFKTKECERTQCQCGHRFAVKEGVIKV